MKTAAIYARYSSDRQTEQSIEGQIHVCTDYAKRNDILIVGTHIDRAMTGTNDNRAQFQQMLKDSDKRAWDYVLVYRLDRFSRNKYEMAIHRKHLKDNGIKILSAMENIPDSPEGILLESLLEGMSEYYAQELSQKTRRGMRESRIKGLLSGGRTPFGWDKTEDRKAVINETEAEIVREIFKSYLRGKTMQQIADDLRERNIMNKDRPFLQSTIYTILHNERYTGVIKIHDEVYDNIYPQIIDKETFDKTQILLTENSTGKHVPDVTYLLRGKVDCAYCGKRFHSAGGADRNGYIRRYYKCNNPKCKGHKSVRKEDLEDIVICAINEVFGSEKQIEIFTDTMLQRFKEKAKENTELKSLEKELAKVTKSITGMLKALEMGVVTESTKERLEELEKQKHEYADAIAIEKTKQETPVSREWIKEHIKKALAEPPKSLIDILVEKVTVSDETVAITFKCKPDNSPDGTRPRKWHRYCKDSDPNDRGSFYMDFKYSSQKPHYKNSLASDVKVDLYVRI